ncbi:hypothetical protein H311_02022 [Anncaliia algerae PRA109]|nr:hypothetical protein H311_02022 [Anncaliia algerae PRA109]
MNGVHMQRIESLWNQLKYRIKIMKGVRRDELSLYLKEFMWRDWYPQNMHLNIFSFLKAGNH